MRNSVSPNTARTFYQNLGNLFYAIAAADKEINEEEVKTLKSLVEEEWVNLDDNKDEFGTDTAYQIEIIFDWLDENRPDAEVAFNEFKDYRQEHQNLFDEETDKLIWKTAYKIAVSFAGKNEDEMVMLAKLKELLE